MATEMTGNVFLHCHSFRFTFRISRLISSSLGISLDSRSHWECLPMITDTHTIYRVCRRFDLAFCCRFGVAYVMTYRVLTMHLV